MAAPVAESNAPPATTRPLEPSPVALTLVPFRTVEEPPAETTPYEFGAFDQNGPAVTVVFAPFSENVPTGLFAPFTSTDRRVR